MYVKTTQVTKAIGSTLLLSVLAQLLGLVRNILLAKDFGTGEIMNAFLLANTYTNLISNIAVSAIAVVLIPYLAQVHKDTDKGIILQTYMTSMLLLVALLCFGIVVIGYFSFPIISDRSELTFWLMLLLLIIPFF
ncbi:hypothetical protein [Listeria cornellensis]|uniref:Peptidoglycan lipid II flippase MurJ n=1 Tax=Listeria cornellensis FSL F6-0969 TaxID=1265820 RepID=W7BZD4_9LIST|nr:hypothetical protein [Listeria cornellensis]EUJ30220.1 peptidoglycan lipid II flippase MurJ [Listeria cornellensis FSL F6-0969]